MKTKLIKVYCHICQLCECSIVANEMQRFTNNCRPKFTDEEVITCYIWGVLNGKSSVKDVYKFIRDYWGDWFPLLPKYHAFNHRINQLHDVLPTILTIVLSNLMPYSTKFIPTLEHLLDSMPIIVAGWKRSNRARAANSFCNKGYCSSKGLYYYGAKVHILGMIRPGSFCTPAAVRLTGAKESDITVAKEWLNSDFANLTIFADKAYIDKNWHQTLKQLYNISIVTPKKLAKGQQFLDAADKIYSQGVSRIRQAVETMFNWLNEKVNLQNASKVRSEKSLFVHVFGKLIAACFALVFNF